MCNVILSDFMQIICKTCTIRFFMSKAFQKAKVRKIGQRSHSGSVPEDSGSSSLDLKRGLYEYLGKVRKF